MTEKQETAAVAPQAPAVPQKPECFGTEKVFGIRNAFECSKCPEFKIPCETEYYNRAKKKEK